MLITSSTKKKFLILILISYFGKYWIRLRSGVLNLVSSSNKTKKLHICRKRICNHNLFTININNNAIKNVESLKILGIHFSKKYTWKEHYISLKKSLEQRVNLIGLLSSKPSYVHINTHKSLSL